MDFKDVMELMDGVFDEHLITMKEARKEKQAEEVPFEECLEVCVAWNCY